MRPNESIPQERPAIVGPGLITGASDDDPSGIGITSQVARSSVRHAVDHAVFHVFPSCLHAADLCTHRSSHRRGNLGNCRRTTFHPGSVFPSWHAGCSQTHQISPPTSAPWGLHLAVGGRPCHALYGVFAILSLVLQVFVPYSRYVRMLKWLEHGALRLRGGCVFR